MKSIVILGKRVKIKQCDLLQHGVMAQYNSLDKSIYIDRSLTGKEYIATLMHEIGHAICDIYGFRQAHFSIDLEELIVENFANVFVETMEIKFGTESNKPVKKRNTKNR